MEVHNENAGDRKDSPRSLRIVRTRHCRQRVPVGGALTCAERARGAKLEGGTWKRDVSRTGDASQLPPGTTSARCHKPGGAAGIGSCPQPDTSRGRETLLLLLLGR